MNARLPSKVAVFYPFFPKYRQEILQCLSSFTEGNASLIAGTRGRASIEALAKNELPSLTEVRTIRLGPVSLHPSIVVDLCSDKYGAVVLAPATLSASVWITLILRRIRGRRTFLWGQCGRPGDRSFKRSIQEIMNRMASGLLVYGDEEKHGACELGLPPRKVTVVGNAFRSSASSSRSDAEKREQALKRGIGQVRRPHIIRLLYVGRVTRSKRLDRLVEAVSILRNMGLNVEATVVGGGEALEDLRSMIDRYSVPILAVGPEFDADRLSFHFNEATIVVAPNSIGLLAVEALRNRVPVVYPESSDSNGPEVEILTTGINAVGFTSLTPEGLANAVVQWLDESTHVRFEDYESVTAESIAAWSPEIVAKKILRAVGWSSA